MRDVAEQLRIRQREWLMRVVREHGIKPTPLAKAAGVAATTLTRKLNDPNDTAILTDLTVARICQHLHIEPPNFISGDPPPRASGFADADAAPYEALPDDPMKRAIEAVTGNQLHLVPWELRSRVLEHEGYRPGDVLIMNMNIEAKPGDIVCAQLYNWSNPAATETVFRLYEAPYLVPGGPTERHRAPIPVDGRNVMIKAVLDGMIRRRRPFS